MGNKGLIMNDKTGVGGSEFLVSATPERKVGFSLDIQGFEKRTAFMSIQDAKDLAASVLQSAMDAERGIVREHPFIVRVGPSEMMN